MEQAESSALFQLIIPTLDHLRQALSYADMLSAFPAALARQRLLEDSLRHTEPDMPWPIIRLAWHCRAASSAVAQALSGYAENIHHILPFVAQLLEAPPQDGPYRLAAAACMDMEGTLVLDMLAIEAEASPRASHALSELRRLRQARQQIDRLLGLPADLADGEIRAVASEADEQRWRDHETILHFLADQNAGASRLLSIGAQVRGG